MTGQIHNLGPAERVPLGEGRVFEAGGESIAVFRTRAGVLYAVQASCPHRGGPLADGLVGGSVVVCPFHSFRFDLATGRPLGNDCAGLRTYPVTLSPGGDILVETSLRAARAEESVG